MGEWTFPVSVSLRSYRGAGHAERGVHEAAQDRPQGRSGCPLNIFFPISSWARLAGVHTPNSDISTRPRPATDSDRGAPNPAPKPVASRARLIENDQDITRRPNMRHFFNTSPKLRRKEAGGL